MGTRSEYAPGTFSWVDLGTTDTDAAKAFYGDLFGWQFDDQPIGDDAVYTMCKLDGQDVCAIAPMQQEQQEQGIPPHWNNYVTVASADDAAAKAKDAGGNVLLDAFDVMEVGRMAVIQDPQGAAFMVWEAKAHIGAGIVNAPGALTWNELHTSDVDGAQSFYGDLFGWSFDPMDTGGGPPYVVIRHGDRANGGVMPTQEGEPPNWVPYFATEGVEDTLSKVTSGGGEKLAGPYPMPQGQIAFARDPQGAAFALWEGELED
jgi:uncharacterized protein